MLAGAGLGDDASLPHPLREQRLSERVVDLVRAGVRQVFALEEDARAAERRRQPPRLVERRRPSDVVAQQRCELVTKRRIGAGGEVRGFELGDRRDERFGHEAPAVRSVVAARVRVAFAE